MSFPTNRTTTSPFSSPTQETSSRIIHLPRTNSRRSKRKSLSSAFNALDSSQVEEVASNSFSSRPSLQEIINRSFSSRPLPQEVASHSFTSSPSLQEIINRSFASSPTPQDVASNSFSSSRLPYKKNARAKKCPPAPKANRYRDAERKIAYIQNAEELSSLCNSKTPLTLENQTWNVECQIQHRGEFYEVFIVKNRDTHEVKALKILKSDRLKEGNQKVKSILTCELLQYAQCKQRQIQVAKFDWLEKLYEEHQLASVEFSELNYSLCEQIINAAASNAQLAIGAHFVEYIPYSFPDFNEVGAKEALEKLKILFQKFHDNGIAADAQKDNIRLNQQGNLILVDLYPFNEPCDNGENPFDILFKKCAKTFFPKDLLTVKERIEALKPEGYHSYLKR